MTKYTTPHSLPLIEPATDTIRSANGDNLWKQLNALAVAAGTAITTEGARAEGAAKWERPGLPTGTDLNTLTTPGFYPIRTYALANSLVNAPRSPNVGVVEVFKGESGVHQRYVFANGFNQPRVVERAGGTTGVFGPWVSMTSLPEPLATGEDVTQITTPGTYSTTTPTVAASLIGLPPAVAAQPGTLKVDTTFSSATAYRTVQTWTTLPYATGQPPRTFTRSATQAGPAHDWIERASVAAGAIEDDTSAGNRKTMLQQASKLRHGGVIGLGGKTAVALSFDHGFANYRDYLLPHLIRLGLPHTVAVNPGTLGSGESAGVGLSQLQTWALAHGVELANHSVSHSDAATPAAMKTAIIGALETIRAGAPKVIVDAYIMPGVSGTGYDGFNAGLDPSKWWTHPAGRMILDNHAVVTSALVGQAVPMAGTPTQTIDRAGVDSASWATVTRERITSLHGSGMGIHVFNHPSAINNGISESAIVSFLEFLAAERDAGRVEVLTVSGFAWASADTTRRFDLSRGAWSAGTATVPLTPLTDWARGGQWQLSVSCSAASTVTLRASDGGSLNTSVTVSVAAGGTARLNFGIPIDSTTLTLSATTTSGTLTAHRVNAI